MSSPAVSLSSRMLKKSPSGVLTGHCRLTVSAAFTGVPCLIRHGVNLRGSTYRLGKRLFIQAMGGRVKTVYASPLRSLRPCSVKCVSWRAGVGG
jgi:hypothetical protein